MRTDPTDTGGLFIGRRPDTVPVDRRWPESESAKEASSKRPLSNRFLAAVWTVAMTVVSLSFWGPLPAAWLWVGSQVNYYTDSVGLGITTAFLGLMASLLCGLSLLRRIDTRWVTARRKGGYIQNSGIGTRIFAITCAVGTILFTAWLLLFSGASLAPLGLSG